MVDFFGVKITEEYAEEIKTAILEGKIIYNDDDGYPLIKEKTNEDIKNEIRIKREYLCFKYINRGQLWYDNLTLSQREELDIWYKAWLDAPETLIIPEKPEWLI